jgi:hypothetical protein
MAGPGAPGPAWRVAYPCKRQGRHPHSAGDGLFYWLELPGVEFDALFQRKAFRSQELLVFGEFGEGKRLVMESGDM